VDPGNSAVVPTDARDLEMYRPHNSETHLLPSCHVSLVSARYFNQRAHTTRRFGAGSRENQWVEVLTGAEC
jgi:hypothetical protein